MVDIDQSMDRYNEDSAYAKFRAKMMDGSFFMNYGISPPGIEKASSLKEANRNMVQWIIDRLRIHEDSHVLDIGCGKGNYILDIAKRTGCTFVGVDILPQYVDTAQELSKRFGLLGKGTFSVGSFENIDEVFTKENQFSYILSMGAFQHVHDKAEQVFRKIKNISDSKTTIFLFDMERQRNWEECKNVKKHLKLPGFLMNEEEMKSAFKLAGLKLLDEEDLSLRVLPSLNRYAEQSLIEDPTSTTLTYPYMAQAFRDGEVKYKAWILKRQED